MKFSLCLPFLGNYPISQKFGNRPDMQTKPVYSKWSITGHDGLDFALPTATKVLAVYKGEVIQSGENDDYGISITIKHSWGTSLYAHLQKSFVQLNDKVIKGKVIALSDQTGFTTGPHLHFAIRLKGWDPNNGYLGYCNPMPYFKN